MRSETRAAWSPGHAAQVRPRVVYRPICNRAAPTGQVASPDGYSGRYGGGGLITTKGRPQVREALTVSLLRLLVPIA